MQNTTCLYNILFFVSTEIPLHKIPNYSKIIFADCILSSLFISSMDFSIGVSETLHEFVWCNKCECSERFFIVSINSFINYYQ